MAELDLTNIAVASIATPASGVTATFVDSTTAPTKRLKTKDDAGTVVSYVGLATTDTGANRLQNKDLDDATVEFVNTSDTTKKLITSLGGATASTTLTLVDQQSTSQSLNIPNITGTDTLVTTGLAQTITGVKTMTNMTTAAGTSSVPSMTQTHGTNLTSAQVDAWENDAIGLYFTTNTTDGRAHVPIRQDFRLAANGGSVSTLANFFGTTSNISLVASAYYDIEILMVFTKTTTEILTVHLTNSAAPTSQNIHWEQSPISGMVAPPGTATALVGFVAGDTTTDKTIAAGSLTTAVNHYIKINLQLKNGTGTSLKIQCSNPAGSITPLLGSYWRSTRIPTGNTGTFAA